MPSRASSILLHRVPTLALPTLFTLQHCLEQPRHFRFVNVQVVDDSIRPSVESVGADETIVLRVDCFYDPDGGARGVVHVEDRRVRVEAGGVEVVAILHTQGSERFKVPLMDRLLHRLHPLRHHFRRPRLEQRRRGHRLLHPRRRTDVLLGGAGDEDDGAQVWPMARGRNFVGDAVFARGFGAAVPGDVPAHETAARGARALTRDAAELSGVERKLV